MIFRLPKLVPCVKVADPQFDGVVIVTDSPSKLVGDLEGLRGVIEKYGEVWDSNYYACIFFIFIYENKNLIYN